MMYLFQLEYNFCCTWMVPVFKETIVAKGTYMSQKLGGFYTLEIPDLALSGWFIINYTFFYHLAVYAEQLYTLLLTLDVLTTIQAPFERVVRLKLFMSLHKVLVFIMVMFSLSTIPYALNKAEEMLPGLRQLNMTDAKAIMDDKYSLDHLINLYYNPFSLVLHLTNLAIFIYSFLVCICAYFA